MMRDHTLLLATLLASTIPGLLCQYGPPAGVKGKKPAPVSQNQEPLTVPFNPQPFNPTPVHSNSGEVPTCGPSCGGSVHIQEHAPNYSENPFLNGAVSLTNTASGVVYTSPNNQQATSGSSSFTTTVDNQKPDYSNNPFLNGASASQTTSQIEGCNGGNCNTGNQNPNGGSQPSYPGNQYPSGGSQPSYPGNQYPSGGSQPSYPGNLNPNGGSQTSYPGNQNPSGSYPSNNYPTTSNARPCNVGTICVNRKMCDNGFVNPNNALQGKSQNQPCELTQGEICCTVTSRQDSPGSPGLVHVQPAPGSSPGLVHQGPNRPAPGLISAGGTAPVGSAIRNPTQRPQTAATWQQWTGPQNVTPHPGCAAALKCVPLEFCTWEGVMTDTPQVLTREEDDSRVPLSECSHPETGVIGKCCRDPNYKDPWPDMLPGGGCYQGTQCEPMEKCDNDRMAQPKATCNLPQGGASVGICCITDRRLIGTNFQQNQQQSQQINTQVVPQRPPVQTTYPQNPPQQPSFPNQVNQQPGFNKPNLPPSYPQQQPQQPGFPPQNPQQQYPGPGQQQQQFPAPSKPIQQQPQPIPEQQYPGPGQQQQQFPAPSQQYPSPSQPIPQQQYPNTPIVKPQPVNTGFVDKVDQNPPIFEIGQAPPQPQFPPSPSYENNQPNQQQQQQQPNQQQPTHTNFFQQQSPSAQGPSSSYPRPQQNKPKPVLAPQPVVVQQQSLVPPQYPQLSTQYRPGQQCGVRRVTQQSGLLGDDGQSVPGEFPWLVLITLPANNSRLCAGALVSDKAVLTSAHCVLGLNPEDLRIEVGSWSPYTEVPERQSSPVVAIAKHPNFDAGALFNDMAVLLLPSPLRLGEHVDLICLPEPEQIGQDGELVNPGGACVMSSWPKTGGAESYLHRLAVGAVPKAKCEESLRQTYLGKYFQLNRSFMCAAPLNPQHDICSVGLGGPLVCPQQDGRYVVTGASSWDVGCTEKKSPAVMCALDVGWINEVLTRPVEDFILQPQEQQQINIVDESANKKKPGFSQGYGK